MGTNSPEMKERAFKRWLADQTPERLAELERTLREDLHKSLAAIMDEFGLSRNSSAFLNEHFGIDSNWRRSAHAKAKSMKLILDRISDIAALERKIRAGVLTSHDVRRLYGLNYEQWRKLIAHLGITPDDASEFHKNATRSSTGERSHVVADSMSKDGSSLQWLSKKW